MSRINFILDSPEQIAYFLGASNYCWVYFRTGERKLLAKPIGYVEAQMPEFIRVHKTVLVNPCYIKSLHQPPTKKKAGEVHLDTGDVFPVSRRRWQSVTQRWPKPSTMAADHQPVAVLPSPPAFSQPTNFAALSIILVSNDQQKTLRVEHLLGQQWSAYRLAAIQWGTQLIDLLRRSPESDYPALILVDAQTATAERLWTLQRLKESSQLSHIPVILLVPPINQLIIEGYQYQANSVVLLLNQYTYFDELLARVLHYWLDVVALPGITEHRPGVARRDGYDPPVAE